MPNRDDFSEQVKRSLAGRAGYTCSNPNCRRSLVAGAQTDTSRIVYLGVAAHITAAALNGPRYDPALTPTERMALANAILLCPTCAQLIDKNAGRDYPVPLLRQWKAEHEQRVQMGLDRPNPANPPTMDLLPVDQLVLLWAGDAVQVHDLDFEELIPVRVLLAQAQLQDINHEIVIESLAILEDRKLIKQSHYLGPPPEHQQMNLTASGFDSYLRTVQPGYDGFMDKVARWVVEHRDHDLDSFVIAEALNESHLLVTHALVMLHKRGYIEILFVSGLRPGSGRLAKVGSIDPKLTRALRLGQPLR